MFLTEFMNTESTEHCELVQHTTKTKDRYETKDLTLR